MLEPLGGRQLRLEEAQEGEQRVAEAGQVDVVQLHVHDEVLAGEDLARRRRVVALRGGHRQQRRLALRGEAVHLVEDHVGGRRAGGGAQEGASRQAQPRRAALRLLQ